MTEQSSIAAAIRLARQALDTSETAVLGVAELRRELRGLLQEVMRKEARRGAWTNVGIGTIIVAVIGALSQVQVARITTAATTTTKSTVERTMNRDDDLIRRIANEAATLTSSKIQEHTSRDINAKLAELRRDVQMQLAKREPK